MARPTWRVLRRKTFAPNRPALWPEQVPLAVLTLLVILGSIVFVAVLVFGH